MMSTWHHDEKTDRNFNTTEISMIILFKKTKPRVEVD